MRSKTAKPLYFISDLYIAKFLSSLHEGFDFFILFYILHSVVDMDRVIWGAHYIYGSHR
jgi:hypothetical protein